MNYLSPYLIVVSASMGIANRSILVFAGLFMSSLLVGRFWCGGLCPASGLNNVCAYLLRQLLGYLPGVAVSAEINYK